MSRWLKLRQRWFPPIRCVRMSRWPYFGSYTRCETSLVPPSRCVRMSRWSEFRSQAGGEATLVLLNPMCPNVEIPVSRAPQGISVAQNDLIPLKLGGRPRHRPWPTSNAIWRSLLHATASILPEISAASKQPSFLALTAPTRVTVGASCPTSGTVVAIGGRRSGLLLIPACHFNRRSPEVGVAAG